MDPNTLTRVRLGPRAGDEALRAYVFGGHFGPVRVPRGVAPDAVGRFLREQLGPAVEASAVERAVEVMRFYERPDALPAFARLFAMPAPGLDDLRRGAFAVQGVADFGGDLLAPADDFVDAVLVAHPEAMDAVSLLLQTRLALAPHGSLDRLAQRIELEVERAEAAVADEATLLAYDRLAALRRNDLPRARAAIERKSAILELEAAERRRTLVSVYLGLDAVSDAWSETWAGRLLRLETMAGGGEAVRAELSAAVAALPASGRGPEEVAFATERACLAILYLEGALTADERERLETAREAGMGGMHFLWDDLPLAPPPDASAASASPRA